MGFINQIIGKWSPIALLLIGWEGPSAEEVHKPSLYLDQVTQQFAKEVKRDFHLSCCMEGASMPKDIQTIDLGFQSRRKLTIEEARILELQLIDRFLALVNSHEKIRPYLREHPFPSKKLFLSIRFGDEKGCYPNGDLAMVSCCYDVILYKSYDPNSMRHPFVTLLQEPIKEARKIATASKTKEGQS